MNLFMGYLAKKGRLNFICRCQFDEAFSHSLDCLLSFESGRRMTAVAETRPWLFSRRTAGLPWNLTSPTSPMKSTCVATDDQDDIVRERRLPQVANRSFGPISDLQPRALNVGFAVASRHQLEIGKSNSVHRPMA